MEERDGSKGILGLVRGGIRFKGDMLEEHMRRRGDRIFSTGRNF